jgi:putative SOS response-associated peptidase YedK
MVYVKNSIITNSIDGDKLTYVIVTTSAADPISGIHDRMPVILEDPSEWLDAKQDWRKTLHSFNGQLSW